MPVALTLLLLSCASSPAPDAATLDSQPYLAAVRSFADTVIEHGRDKYGAEDTPLFVDGLQIETLEPARWQRLGETWVLSNLASQQPLMRTLDGLTAPTGEPRYRQAAEDATSYALANLRTPSGLLSWGGHMAWDLDAGKPVAQYEGSHELKGQQPYFELMWRVNPNATRQMLEAMWAGHILDWARLDYNRHADGRKLAAPQWDASFDDTIEVPSPSVGNNLSFVNVMPSMVHSGVSLATHDDNNAPARRPRSGSVLPQASQPPGSGAALGFRAYRV